MPTEAAVHVVDDDAAVRRSLVRLCESVGLRVETYGSARDVLERVSPASAGCILLDVRMPGMSGLELQTELQTRGVGMPVIVLTGHGDVPIAVRAMKAGAFDFIEKPFQPQFLLDRVQAALARDEKSRCGQMERRVAAERLAQLTRREQQVMNLLVAGKTVKEIALELQLSPKTVQHHRARVLDTLQVNTVGALVRLVMSGDRPEASA